MSSNTSYQDETPVVEVIFEKDLSSSEEPPMEEWSSLLFEVPEENVKRLQYAEGLYDPGSGEICTKYIPLSASSILRHPYYNYPGIIDPGIQEALLHPEPKIIYPDDGQELYMALCNEMDICPVRSFYRELLEDKIDLKFYGINPNGFRAMAMALKLNRFVTVLDLTDNWINEDGCFHLGEMILENYTLTELNLTGCRIGPTGAKRLCAHLHLNKTLRVLNLSKNKLNDDGVDILANAIFRGSALTQINLSYNNLTGKSPAKLAEAFETNNRLTHLDMSWNSMLSPNAIFALCTELSTNRAFEVLNLSWNSLSGSRIGKAIAKLLKHPKLRHLNLSNNKLEGPAIRFLAAGLPRAPKLDTLDLSYNPLSEADAIKLVERLRESKVKLKRLLLDNVAVNAEFMEIRKEVLAYKSRSDTVITWGSLNETFVPKGTDIRDIVFNRCEAICKKSKKRPVDIALVIQQMYRDNPEPLTVKAFTITVRSHGAQLDDDLIEELAVRFPGPRTEKMRFVSLPAMIDYLKRKWPDRKLPPTPPPEPEPIPVPKKDKGKGKKK
ncbi:leucine-rich repeat-containing protein 74B-like [Plodia interpunctella]|uniref:leucine-rich repeat-containing protein 74B-like n=1 Tax=Plodia interpunctella TaxID=58824 RepID=UPI002368E049|nr:leucine-rich repeat-containing protein 74B-like [Plodia interpunctella]